MSHAAAPEPTPSSAPLWPDVLREAEIKRWLGQLAPAQGLRISSLRSASADASFRRYFRIDSEHGSRIIMDAPPALEDSRPFVQVAKLMQAAQLRVPQVLAWDEARGFLLLTDLGPQTMLQGMDREVPGNNQQWYLQAIDALIAWQGASAAGVLPPYDEALLRREMELFPEWYVARHRGVAVEGELRRTLDESFGLIIRDNLAWPRTYVHRDYMPRNLMPGPQGMGVLDFQDAVYGPITYDIASLMRDAFLSWEEDFCLDITIRYWEKARAVGLPVHSDFGAFYRDYEWMGAQRQLKVLGIFARLYHRDGKDGYLKNMPTVLAYLRQTCERYLELRPLARLFDQLENRPQAIGYTF